jgi:tetratricopeptide (TPR) repeat protein
MQVRMFMAILTFTSRAIWPKTKKNIQMKAVFNLLAFYLLIGCFQMLPAYAQSNKNPNNKIDSLRNLLTSSTDDSIKLKLYGAISWEYLLSSQFSFARQYADSIALLANTINDEKGKYYARFYYGTSARHEGKFSEALEHLQAFVDYNTVAGDSSRVAAGLFQLASVKMTLGNYSEALAHYHRILEIHHKNNYKGGVAFTLNTIGVIHRTMKNYESAIKMYKQAILLYDSLDSPMDEADVLSNLATVYLDLDRNNEALKLYHQVWSIDQSIGYVRGIGYDQENIGNLFNKIRLYDSALVYHLQALKTRRTLAESSGIVTSLNKTGFTYYLLKRFNLAEKYLREGLALAYEIKSQPLLRDIYENLSLLYSGNKQFDQAYKYQSLFIQLKDSIMDETVARQLNELQTRYETEKKNQQIELLAQRQKNQEAEINRQKITKRALIIGATLLSLLAGVVVFSLSQRLKNQRIITTKNEQLKEANFKKELNELEIKALQAQINPHFIFNCMNSINSMILNNENESASGYLGKFAKLIRLILESAGSPLVTLENELQLLESYIQLEMLRFKHDQKISYSINVDDDIDAAIALIPPMVLQPFVENSIWHGLRLGEHDKHGMIMIKVKKIADQISCCIEDNGVGREKALSVQEKSIWKGKSLGLKLTRKRLELLNRDIKQQLIHITDLKNSMGEALGTRVEINLPYTL